MSYASFIHLRAHTALSLSEGAVHINDLVDQAVGHHMPAVAMTDTDNMFGALAFSGSAAERGVQPIIGVTLHIKNEWQEIDKSPKHLDTRSQIILLSQSDVGYANLMKIVSRAHLESDPTHGVQLSLDSLKNQSDGLICLSGGANGPVGQAILDGRMTIAGELTEKLADIFPSRFYMELSRLDEDSEQATEEGFIDLAYTHNIPLVATNQVYFSSSKMYDAHDTLMCISAGTYVSDESRVKLTQNYRFKSPEEMVQLFSDLPEAIENTIKIAQRCHYRVKPIDPLLPNFAKGLDISEAEMLAKQTREGLRDRLMAIESHDSFSKSKEGSSQNDEEWQLPYWERLDYELKIINQMGFPGYFLIVADFIQWAKDQEIPVGPGRGSGAGSVVAWALKITDLDPLQFSLLFERFLNPERVSMPDFDIDFCQDRREEVIRYVQNKYGHDRVAQIITFGKLQARAVVKACGRALQQPYMVSDRLSKLIPNDPGNALSLREAIAAEPRLKAEIENDALTAEVMDRALKLEGLYAHSSTHAAGVVIGDRPLDELVPLYRDPKSDMPVTQFDLKWVEKAGLVKFDFLGLKTLTVLDRAVKLVARRGIKIDLAAIPFDNQLSFELLSSGDTAGVFQLESPGMRSTLKGMKPDCFEDIIALVALYRPGPMDNIPTYVKRKHGREEINYPHEILKDILSETNGIIVYQEQVMQIAQVMSGYSLGEADLLRRAMGKKIQSEMDQQRGRFVSGAEERGIPKAKANEIFDLVTKFASYGFNKSHAAAYALVAYQTAYMKANFPVEFMAAIMTLDMGNTDKLGAFKQELQRMEIPILLPDVNRSEALFSVEEMPSPYCNSDDDPRKNLGIRYALAAIKGVGGKAIETLVQERRENGAFTDLYDLSDKLDVKQLNKRQLEHLAAAGAFDTLISDRAQAYGSAELLLRLAHSAAEERASNQVSLFGEITGAEIERPPLPSVKKWTDAEQLAAEHRALGFYLSAHPLDIYEHLIKRERIISAREAMNNKALVGDTVAMAGSLVNWREGKAKASGRPFGILTLSDRSDSFELMVREADIQMVRDQIAKNTPLVASVMIRPGRNPDEGASLSLKALETLEQLSSHSAESLLLDIGPQADQEALETLKTILQRKSGGQGRVIFRLPVKSGEYFVEIRLKGKYLITPELKQAVATEQCVEHAEAI